MLFLFQEFNPNLIGYARKDSYNFEEFADFNVAEPMAMSRDMPHMSQVLIDRLKSDPRVDIRRHWKVWLVLIKAKTRKCILCDNSQINKWRTNRWKNGTA